MADHDLRDYSGNPPYLCCDGHVPIGYWHEDVSEQCPLCVCRNAHMANCLAKDKISAAWHAACAFIDSHVADPDLTAEMILKYEAFKKWREVVANGSAV